MVQFSYFVNQGAHTFILHWSLQIMSIILDKIQRVGISREELREEEREEVEWEWEKEKEWERKKEMSILMPNIIVNILITYKNALWHVK